jgi:hypothetical protein
MVSEKKPIGTNTQNDNIFLYFKFELCSILIPSYLENDESHSQYVGVLYQENCITNIKKYRN